MKREFILEGLDCSNCAIKIEQRVAQLEGVNLASLNFATKSMTMELNNQEQAEVIIDKMKAIVKKLESHVVVIEKDKAPNSNAPEKKAVFEKLEFVRLGAGTLLFIIGIAFSFVHWLELSIFIAAYLLIGSEVLIKSLKNIINGQVFDENFLMTIATIGAFAINEYPEGVAVMLFYQIGELFQDAAVNKSRRSIKELLNIRPDYANLMIDKDIIQISAQAVNVGDIIVVKPGERVPLDGKIIKGSSALDTSALTGEAMPREAEVGDEILSGSINLNGLIYIKVSKLFGESTVSKILELVQNASSKKAPTENFITKFARYYTPVVVFISAAIAVLPPLVIEGALFSDWLYRALIFLVVSCPCALVISIPLGFFGGIGGASRNGILIKGSNYLEALNNIHTVVFDKTGTLTRGEFAVTAVIPEGIPEEELIQLAAYAESYSSHPIAQSIVKAYKEEIDKSKISEYEEISGYGVKVTAFGKNILAGNSKLMNSNGIKINSDGFKGTIVYVAADGKYIGCISIADQVKNDSAATIKGLKALKINNTVMLTGDAKEAGEAIAMQLGIDTVYTELLPQNKVELIEKLEGEKKGRGSIVFMGDGINDAPVLTRADIGIAMGGVGSDAAIEAADIVIMNDSPSKLLSAIKIAKFTKMVVWQNIIFAFAVKLAVLLLGAGGLATMWEAVFADVGVALLAVLNAMRVLKYKAS